MKKIVALILAATMAFSLAACGAAANATPEQKEAAKEAVSEVAEVAKEAAEEKKEEAAPAEAAALPYEGVTLGLTVPILVDEQADLEFWTNELQNFTDTTGAKVELTQYTYGDLITSEMANLIAGEAPDILFVSGGSEYDFWNNGYFELLDGYFTDEQISYWTYYDQKVMPDGKHFVVPFIGGACPRPINLNVTMANELGIEVPEKLNWETMTEMAQKAVAAGKKGYVSPFSGNENALITNYFNYVKQAGGSCDNAEGKWDFTTPEALKAMTFVYDMFNTSKIIDTVAYDMDATYASFFDGEALFSAGNVAKWANSLDSFTFDFKLYELEDVQGAAFATTDSFAINSASENKQAAADLIAYIMSPEHYLTILEALDPTQFDNCCNEPLGSGYPECAAHLVNYDTCYWPPVAQGSGQIKEALQTHQQLCALGQETPEEALAAVQAVADEVQ